MSLNANSRVDVDPDIGDARRLRALARRLTKKEHVNPAFPAIDVSCFEESSVRVLYTLADIDDFARANPREERLGYISCIIKSLKIVVPYKRNMLLSAECCGIAVFANAINTTCKQCEKEVNLRINPSIVRVQPLTAFKLLPSPLATSLPQPLHCSYGPRLTLMPRLALFLTRQGRSVVESSSYRIAHGESFWAGQPRNLSILTWKCCDTWSNDCYSYVSRWALR